MTKDKEFETVVKRLLSTPPKPHNEGKGGKGKVGSKTESMTRPDNRPARSK